MKFLQLLLLSSFLQLPMVALNQEPLMSIVQQVDETQKVRVDQLNIEGVALYQKSEYAAALEKWQEALALARKIGFKSGEGAALSNIGAVYQSLGQYPKALEYFQQSLMISKAIGNKPLEGSTLNNIGEVYLSLGQYPKALEYFQQSLMISKAIGNKPLESTTLNNIGGVYDRLGKYPKALEYYQQALVISKAIGDKYGEGITLNNIGSVYKSIGQYPKALEYYQQALVIGKAIRDKSSEGRILNNIGGVYDSLGQYPKALEYYQQALVINKSIGNKTGEGRNLNNIGGVNNSLGQYPKALEYYQQALVISKAIGDKSGEGTTLGNIGLVYDFLGQYPKALEYYQQALVISKAISDKAGEGVTLNNIGLAYQSLGQYPKTLEYYQQALVISKAIGKKPLECLILNNIGGVYGSLGKNAIALEYYQKSLVISKGIGDNFGEGRTFNNIAYALLNLKKPVLAEKPLREAIAIWEAIRGSKNNSGQGLSDSDKVSFADRVAITYKLLQRSLIEQNKPQVALEVAERGRARALAELLAARAINAATNTPIISQAPNLAKIQQIAKSQNATLVEYSLINESIYIWVISPNGAITFQQSKLPANTNIKDLVNTSRDDIGVRGRSGSRNAPSSPAAAQGNLKLLHKLLIAPIAKSLPKDPNQRIIFIPQGELFFVPFVALQDSNDKYLIEQHTISTASAIGLLDSTPKPAKFNPRQGTSIVVGNPIMPLAPDGTQLVPLDGAEKEAIAIGSILKTTPLIGAQADKNIVINKMRSASIIHLATHGLLDKVRGDIPGAIALTNGLLTSNEIFDLKLQANLVVLSACDTGVGDLSGDGVIGLSRALAAAGTPSVAVSLWSVNDSSTQELMVEFYQNWYGKGMNKDQAMRQAMLEVMKSREKPRDWAAFTILGEAR
jgi:CHAT domain-containing protein/Tfp pilus assembly protein PilF